MSDSWTASLPQGSEEEKRNTERGMQRADRVRKTETYLKVKEMADVVLWRKRMVKKRKVNERN